MRVIVYNVRSVSNISIQNQSDPEIFEEASKKSIMFLQFNYLLFDIATQSRAFTVLFLLVSFNLFIILETISPLAALIIITNIPIVLAIPQLLDVCQYTYTLCATSLRQNDNFFGL